MRNQWKKDKKLLSCLLLCSLLFFVCGQEMEPPKEAAALFEAVEETEEAEKVIIEPEEAAISDLSETRDVEETLALLIEDDGFRECARYWAGIAEEDSPKEVLQKLENCERLVLDPQDNPIYSLEALSLFSNLKSLLIDIDEGDDSAIADFTPVAQLTRLESLNINYDKEESIDLSVLGGMHTVTELFLTRCRLADAAFLEQMPQLKCLSLYETPMEDLAVLEHLSELVELSLCGNKNAKHIEAVGTLAKMQDLGMQYCGIEDISFLSGLTELRGVNLNGNSVTDLTPLAGLDKLERLGLSENGVKDISALSDLHNLYDLALDYNEIQDISALTELSHLNQVGIADNQIEDLSPLAGKEELMYAAVFGNPVRSMEPVWEVPRLSFTDKGVSEEEEALIADWLAKHHPEAATFTCIDFIEGDLNDDGRQDIAFVVDSEAFDVYEGEDFPERMPDERRMFVLLQQEDGSWSQQQDTPQLGASMSGGMRGDPYYGAFMQAGYLVIKQGWGSSTGTVQTDIYEYRSGSFRLVKQVRVDDSNYTVGYDVKIQDERSGTWQRYAIAADGYRWIRVDLEDSEHPTHKAFPRFTIYAQAYYIYDKAETQIPSEEALDRVCEAVVEEGESAVLEKLPYADWQKEGYELLTSVTLPDYYYQLSGTAKEAEDGTGEWEGDYLYYDGIVLRGGINHLVCLRREREIIRFLLDDVTGEVSEDKEYPTSIAGG